MRSSSRSNRVETTPQQPIAPSSSTLNPPTIAIIGGGLSGTLVAIYLLKTATHPLQIKLIERRAQLGAGIAYSTQQDCHLLNVPANKISAFAADPDHFLRWLHRCVDRSLPAAAFVPRKHYGHYVLSLLQQAAIDASPQVQFEQITDEAVSIRPNGNRLAIVLRYGDRQLADQIVLAVGNPLPGTPAFVTPCFYQSPRYIASAWSNQALSSLEPDAAVLLIGSGLTAVDVVLTLRQQGHSGLIHLVSRRGLLPRSHPTTAAQFTTPSIDWGHLNPHSCTTRGLLRQVRQQIERANATGQDWRSVIDALRPQVQTLWQHLSLPEKQRFLRHVRPYWDVYRHRMAASIAQQIEALLQERQVLLHAACIQSCRAATCEAATGVEVVMRQRGSNTLETLQVQAVVNCTGPAGNYGQLADPAITSLLAAGLIRTDPLNLGLDVAPDGALIAANGIPSRQFYTIGSLKRGRLWETTAIPEIRDQASTLAEQLLHNTISIAAPATAISLRV